MTIYGYAQPGTGTLGDEVVSSAGTSSISSTQVRSGNYSYRVNPTTTGTGFVAIGNFGADGTIAATAHSPSWCNFWFYAATLPATEETFASGNNGATAKLTLKITSGGIIKSYNTLGTLVATGTTALSAGTWYNIGIQAANGTTTYTVQINGVTELTGTANMAASNVTQFRLGKMTDSNSGSVDFYYNDIILDDAQFNYGKFGTLLRPNANGTTMAWTAGTGASNYTQVNETPHALTDYIQSTGTAGDVALFTKPTMAASNITGTTVAAVIPIAFLRENTSVTSSVKLRLVSGATTTDTTGLNATITSQALGNVLTTDPNTGSAWTEANVDAAQWGAIEANAVAQRMTWAGIYIIYTPTATFSWKVRSEFNSNLSTGQTLSPTVPWNTGQNQDFFFQLIYEPKT